MKEKIISHIKSYLYCFFNKSLKLETFRNRERKMQKSFRPKQLKQLVKINIFAM